MPARLRLHDLPLLTSGLPEAAETWLRLAGVPVRPLASSRVPARSGGEAAAQLLLYDGRSAEARSDARFAREQGLRVLDTAGIWDSNTAATDATRSQRLIRSQNLERLKNEIERAGGTWMRVADYPFPYQCAACFGTKAAQIHSRAYSSIRPFAGAFEPLPARFTEAIPVACHRVSDSTYVVDRTADQPGCGNDLSWSDHEIDAWIRRRYSHGLPFALDETPGPLGADDASVPFDARRYPLLWQTSLEEFAIWWKHRAAITFTARCRGTVIHIECDDDPNQEFRPMLELWRGRHVASFPLHPGEMTLREDGLVFLQEHMRHPAGFAPIWAEFAGTTDHHAKYLPRPA